MRTWNSSWCYISRYNSLLLLFRKIPLCSSSTAFVHPPIQTFNKFIYKCLTRFSICNLASVKISKMAESCSTLSHVVSPFLRRHWRYKHEVCVVFLKTIKFYNTYQLCCSYNSGSCSNNVFYINTCIPSVNDVTHVLLSM